MTDSPFELSLDCSCGGDYAPLDEAAAPELYAHIHDEALYRCDDCGSIIGVKQTRNKALAQIKVYDNILKDSEQPPAEIGDFDSSPNILSLHERAELNRSRIQFDISKNFLFETVDNTKIRFNRNEDRIVCRESEIGENLWHIDVSPGAKPAGIFYLDYQMVYVENQPRGTDAKTHGLRKTAESPGKAGQDRESKLGSTQPTERTGFGPSPSAPGPTETVGADEPNSGHSPEEEAIRRQKIYAISRSENKFNFEFQMAAPRRHRYDFTLPPHNSFRVIDPILGKEFIRRQGKLLAHSLGMDVLYFAWETDGRYFIESHPVQDSLSNHSLTWRVTLPAAPELMVEYDDFLIVTCRSGQLELFTYPADAPPSDEMLFLVERKNGRLYELRNRGQAV